MSSDPEDKPSSSPNFPSPDATPQLQRVTKETLIGDVVTKYPFVADYLFYMGIGCSTCSFAMYETLEVGLSGHGGLFPEQVDEVIKEINALIDEYELSQSKE